VTGPAGSVAAGRGISTVYFTHRSNPLPSMDRCTAAVSNCRSQLADVRLAVKSSCSHREKAALLLAAATDAVRALENIPLAGSVASEVEKALPPLADQVQSVLDRAEAVVKVYGQMTGVEKLVSRTTAAAKYTEIMEQFRSLALQVSFQHGPNSYYC
jgi:hypothetical protein